MLVAAAVAEAVVVAVIAKAVRQRQRQTQKWCKVAEGGVDTIILWSNEGRSRCRGGDESKRMTSDHGTVVVGVGVGLVRLKAVKAARPPPTPLPCAS